MRKLLLLTIALSCAATWANAQMKVRSNGSVSLPSTDIAGNLRVVGGIDGVLIGEGAVAEGMEGETAHDKLLGLEAVPFYKSVPEGEAGSRPLGHFEAQSLSKRHYALSAEQLEAVYPDLVYVRDDGTKGINYIELIPLLVQAIGELTAKIEALEDACGRQTRAMADGGAGTGRSEGLRGPSLGQNAPNPFAGTTHIELAIPSEAREAALCIYDMAGKPMRQLPLADRGRVSLTFTGEGLASGMYFYSLVVDGKLVDTNRMVLAR